MRKFDKTKNLIQANLLAEQRYLQTKGLLTENIDELSKGLADKAIDASFDKQRGVNGEIAQKNLQTQRGKFANYVNPDMEAFVAKYGMTMKSGGFGVVELHFKHDGNPYSEGPIMLVQVTKDGYDILHGDVNRVAPNLMKALPRIIEKIKADLNSQTKKQSPIEPKI